MSTIVTQGDEKPRELHPPGLHQAVCVFVEDIGLQKSSYKGQEKIARKIIIVWESEATMSDGKPFMLSKRYTASLFDKAQLRIDLQAWRGKSFTAEELESFDVDSVIGANCFLNIMHETVGDKTYANIKGIAPLKAFMQKMKATITTVPTWIAEQRAKQVTVGDAEKAAPAGVHVDESDSLPF